MRHITQQGLNLIKHFEGFSSNVYKCPAGLPTIGYGHLIKQGEVLNSVTEDEAEELLRHDVQVAEKAVLRLINIPLTDGQFDALVSFTFNLGSGSLQSSTLRRKVNRQEHDQAPIQLRRWVWSGGRKLKGLQLRRDAESTLYELG